MSLTDELKAKGHTVTGEVCEKCWADAFMRSMEDTSKSQSDHYADITIEAENESAPTYEPTVWTAAQVEEGWIDSPDDLERGRAGGTDG